MYLVLKKKKMKELEDYRQEINYARLIATLSKENTL